MAYRVAAQSGIARCARQPLLRARNRGLMRAQSRPCLLSQLDTLHTKNTERGASAQSLAEAMNVGDKPIFLWRGLLGSAPHAALPQEPLSMALSYFLLRAQVALPGMAEGLPRQFSRARDRQTRPFRSSHLSLREPR
jgi:hypothetical protein